MPCRSLSRAASNVVPRPHLCQRALADLPAARGNLTCLAARVDVGDPRVLELLVNLLAVCDDLTTLTARADTGDYPAHLVPLLRRRLGKLCGLGLLSSSDGRFCSIRSGDS